MGPQYRVDHNQMVGIQAADPGKVGHNHHLGKVIAEAAHMMLVGLVEFAGPEVARSQNHTLLEPGMESHSQLERLVELHNHHE